MNQRLVYILLTLLLLSPILSACTKSAPSSEATETPSKGPTSKPPAAPTATPSPADTPMPTDVEAPTATPHSTGRVSGQAEIVRSQMQRETSPDVPPTDLAELVASNNAFAFDLYQALHDRGGNLFYSPYSISTALAMAYAGARGSTEQQMADTLHFTLSQDRLHPAFNALDLELSDRSSQDFKLYVANAVWGQTGHHFLDAFLNILAQSYDAGLRLLDFASAPEPAREIINDWISDQTEDKIQDLIPQGGITRDTRLVLANAIYFNAQWMYPFAQPRTQDGVFNTLDGGQVTVSMMAMSHPPTLAYSQGERYQAIELPYTGGEMAMVILVPDPGQFDAFETTLDTGRIDTILSDLEPKQVALTMPKFNYKSAFSLAGMLAAMGMPDAFDATQGDFSGMDGTRDLVISDVFHKAFVAVDEAGTEAAAATAVVVGVTSLPAIDVELVIDRPFIFIIRDVETRTILFAGRVVNPGG